MKEITEAVIMIGGVAVLFGGVELFDDDKPIKNKYFF